MPLLSLLVDIPLQVLSKERIELAATRLRLSWKGSCRDSYAIR